MNEVEKHETGKTCNVCGGPVISQYGCKKCDNFNCPAAIVTQPIEWDSTDEEIEEWREAQIQIAVEDMTTHIEGVDDLEKDDIITIDHDDHEGEWRVSDTDNIDVGLTEFDIATVVQDDEGRALIGPCTNAEGKTVQIRLGDADEVVANVSPNDINVVTS